MTEILTCISPVDGSVYAERPAAQDAEIQTALDRAADCRKAWRQVPVAERAALCSRMVDIFIQDKDAIAKISEQRVWTRAEMFRDAMTKAEIESFIEENKR